MAAGFIGGDDAHELAVTVKALEEGYAFLIGGGADEAAKAEICGALKKRALQLLGLPASGLTCRRLRPRAAGLAVASVPDSLGWDFRPLQPLVQLRVRPLAHALWEPVRRRLLPAAGRVGDQRHSSSAGPGTQKRSSRGGRAPPRGTAERKGAWGTGANGGGT